MFELADSSVKLSMSLRQGDVCHKSGNHKLSRTKYLYYEMILRLIEDA